MKPETPGHIDPREDRAILLTDRQRKILFSPLRLVLIIALSVFVTDMLNDPLTESFHNLTKMQETLIDSSGVTIVLFLVLFFYLFRPLENLVNDCKQNEVQLKAHQEQLEQRVQERTRELETALQRLKEENEESNRAKQAQYESEERFRQIYELSEDAIVLIAPQDGTVIDMNPTAERLFRRQRQDVLGGGLNALCDSASCKQLTTAIEQITLGDAPGMIENFDCIIAPGDVRVFSFRGKKIKLQGADIVFSTFRDITNRIRMEEEAHDIQSRLIQTNRMTSLGMLVCSVAHEINNPNNFMLMNAGILKRAWDDIAPIVEDHFNRKGDFAIAQSTWSEARSFLPEAYEGILQGALRIRDIVVNLKEFSCNEGPNCKLQADVNKVVRMSVSILNHQISRSTRHFQLELAKELPLAIASTRQLEQVVINLIQNALQSLPDPDRGVRVTTGTDPDSGNILIRVTDEGNGIPPEIAARVMEPFFTTRLDQGGTGLGLAISSSIVKEHGGLIEFSSDPGKDTTFTVSLCRALPIDREKTTSEVNHDKS